MHRIILLLLAVVMLISISPAPIQSRADAADFDIPNGHFYTQAAGPDAPSGSGYSIVDAGVDDRGQTIRFWSEFNRLGGVNALGFPASRRFTWNGFVCQATQRVVMQWRPEVNMVYFVNVMDLITEAGKDDYLLNVRQTPKPYDFKPEEQGLSFQQIVNKRYALLDAYPAIKAVFFSVPDPLQLNGLPTTPVTDMGDAYVLRAQRKIFQQWKKDVPWAKAGQVTVALGGDIAKEVGLIQAQDPQAVVPVKDPRNIPALEVVSSSSYIDSINYLHIVGEVRNNSSQPMQFVKIVATLSDDAGNLTGTMDTYTMLDILLPGAVAPFDSITNSFAGTKRYTLQVQGRSTTEMPRKDLVVLNSKTSIDSIKFLHIQGMVQNNGTTPARFVRLVITLYDAKGTVIGAVTTYASLEVLQPGATSPFDAITNHYPGFDHYIIQVQGRS